MCAISLRLVDEPVPSDTPTFSTAYMHKTSTESPVILLPESTELPLNIPTIAMATIELG